MTRPPLHPLPPPHVLTGRIITMSEGQWDDILATAYDLGWILLELSDEEEPVAAYQRPDRPADHWPEDLP
jgi:hypothetical protein